jgi:DNA polymerase V
MTEQHAYTWFPSLAGEYRRPALNLHTLLAPLPKVKRQICVSRSFGSATESLQDLCAAVAFFPSIVAEKKRAHRLLAGKLSVFVSTDPCKNGLKYSNNARLSVASKSDSTLELLPLALKGLDQVHREEVLMIAH